MAAADDDVALHLHVVPRHDRLHLLRRHASYKL
jgi:hypothetical protein